MSISTSYNVQVKYNEAGAHGMVYHASYYSWYELAQYEFLKEIGFTFRDMMDNEVFFTLTEMDSKFLAPAMFGDSLRVDMTVLGISNIKVQVEYQIVRPSDGKIIVRSKATYACVDKDFKPLLLNRAVPGLYALLKEACEEQ